MNPQLFFPILIVIYYIVNFQETLEYFYSFRYKNVNVKFFRNKIYISDEITSKNSKENILYLQMASRDAQKASKDRQKAGKDRQKASRGEQISTLDKATQVYIIINSGGGNFFGGYEIIQEIKYLKSIGVIVNCIGLKAHSAAFDILQSCTNRYITPNAKLMQHDLIIEFTGTVTEFEETYEVLDLFKALNKELIRTVLKKSNITLAEYNELIKYEWRLNGYKEILKYNLAYEVINFYD